MTNRHTVEWPADLPDSDEHTATRTLETLLAAVRDEAPGTAAAEHALNALHHVDPARLRRHQHVLLRRILTALGGLVLDRAATVERGFHQDGGGNLAAAAVRRAAQAALKTYDKFIYANCRITGLLDEDTYLHIVTQLITAENNFDLASRYASRRNP